MIDAKELLNSLSVDDVKTILIELGAQHIEDLSETKGHLITNTICHNISDGKMKLYYYTESNGKFEGRKFHCFTACGDNFDIFELVKRNHELKGIEMSFRDIINWICNKTGRKNYGYSRPEGFEHGEKVNDELEYLKKFDRKKIEAPELVIHDECILGRFTDFKHDAFLSDGISEDAMTKFKIKFNYIEHSVVIPHFNKDGKLISLKQRSLSEDMINRGFKYIPYQTFGENGVLYSHPTQYSLYGYYQNQDYIRKVKKAILFESEKSILQCESYFPNQNFSLALGGSNISTYQRDMVLDLNVEEVILCLDKENNDTDDNFSKIYQDKLVRLGRMFAPYVRTFVVYDNQGILDKKDSPSDKGAEVLIQLMKNKKEIRLAEE